MREGPRTDLKLHGPQSPLGISLLLLVAVYATGLSRGVTQPWTGMHDWNGAFFSQLARNILRYPANVHHGMGVVAMGERIPPPEERSIYARHPPALVWMVAAAFVIVGESEWVARLLPITASLATLVLFVRIVQRHRGTETAVFAGLIYALMPMTVYFGRMVNHEAICLMLMLAAVASWRIVIDGAATGRMKKWANGLCGLCLAAVIWVDWAGLLFAVLFCLFLLWQWRHRRIGLGRWLFICATTATACTGVLVYLVYAGLEGRWEDLVAIFNARRTTSSKHQAYRVWTHIRENFSWPVIALMVAGIMVQMGRIVRGGPAWRGRRKAGTESTGDGLGVITATGLLWVFVLWRQFVIHNYWMFYLGPLAAVAAAIGLVSCRDRLRLRYQRIADGGFHAAVTVVVVFCLIGSSDYFSRESFPNELLRASREVQRRTQPGDRVLMFRNPVTIEQHGGYQFRNITMPQHAYYMDRPFDVERNAVSVVRRAGKYPLYVVPHQQSAYPSAMAVIEALTHQFPSQRVGTETLFFLREASQESLPSKAKPE